MKSASIFPSSFPFSFWSLRNISAGVSLKRESLMLPLAPFSIRTRTTSKLHQDAALCSAVYLYLPPAAFTSQPRLMSSSAASGQKLSLIHI